MRKVALLLFAFFLIAAAPGVQQSGQVTPGHVATWTTNGVVQDGGTPGSPAITGGIGVVSSNQGSICSQNSASGARSQICLGVTGSAGYLTLQNFGGGPLLGFNIVINGVTYPFPGPAGPYVPLIYAPLYAAAFGVVGDGVTSNDIALNAAITACSATGTQLVLPPGKILLTGAGSTTSTIQNCAIFGAGFFPGIVGAQAASGTTIELTSTTVKPFTIGRYFSISGVNFYWPNQTSGTTTYPALFTGAVGGSGIWYMDYIGIVNAFVAFDLSTGGGGWFVSHSTAYAAQKLFLLGGTGEDVHLSDNIFDPLLWLEETGYATQTLTAIDAASLVNEIFDIGPQVNGNPVNLAVDGLSAFNWRYGVYIESNGTLGISTINISTDYVLTIVDASSGGVWSGGNKISGFGNCHGQSLVTSTPRGTAPCFNMGANSDFLLSNWIGGGSNGSFVVTSGSNVSLSGDRVGSVGDIADGSDYYLVNVTGGSPGALVVQNNFLSGAPSSTKVHGINTNAVEVGTWTIQNNTFSNFNEDVMGVIGNQNTLTGNTSSATTGSQSLTFTGSRGIIYGLNNWDKPPAATLTSCGTSPSVSGAVAGFITVGGGSVTSCILHLPQTPFGSSGGNCVFQNSAAAVGIGAVLTSSGPPVWTLTFTADNHAAQIFYNCPGQQ